MTVIMEEKEYDDYSNRLIIKKQGTFIENLVEALGYYEDKSDIRYTLTIQSFQTGGIVCYEYLTSHAALVNMIQNICKDDNFVVVFACQSKNSKSNETIVPKQPMYRKVVSPHNLIADINLTGPLLFYVPSIGRKEEFEDNIDMFDRSNKLMTTMSSKDVQIMNNSPGLMLNRYPGFFKDAFCLVMRRDFKPFYKNHSLLISKVEGIEEIFMVNDYNGFLSENYNAVTEEDSVEEEKIRDESPKEVKADTRKVEEDVSESIRIISSIEKDMVFEDSFSVKGYSSIYQVISKTSNSVSLKKGFSYTYTFVRSVELDTIKLYNIYEIKRLDKF